MPRLDRKTAIVAGGTSGIGARIAERFVEEGARVVVAGRRRDKGEALAARLGSAVVFVPADVTREADVAALVDTAVTRFGRLDCIVNNAAYGGARSGIADLDMQQFHEILGVILAGTVHGVKHAARVMGAQGSGSIINTGDIAGRQAGYGSQAYSIAKAGVLHLTRCTAAELGEKGIRVNSISPGNILTGIFGKGHGIAPDRADDLGLLLTEQLAAMQPIPRAGNVDDIAEAAIYLASDASSFVNGHDFVIDGGLTAGRSYSAQLAARASFVGALERFAVGAAAPAASS